MPLPIHFGAVRVISAMSYLVSLVLCGLLLLEFAASMYTDKWAVHVEGGEDLAKEVAERHGFTYIGQIMPDYYHFHHPRVSKRSIQPHVDFHEALSQDPQVRWHEQQVVKRRVKRDNLFNDPKWPRMWYLRRGGNLDMNVLPAWQKGYTGQGVVVSILDDGIEKDHPDLKKNYDAGASYDVNGHDADPQPRYDYTNENRHGTRCAGEVAAQANNGICSVGVAYNARIGGVRMLDGDVTDAVEAQSLSLNTNHIDIYSASWGPDDDGRTVDGPAVLAKKAFFEGISKGRHGLGSIFVWASGNGGRDGDSCNCDGYTNSIYTLSISSATENGNIPWYSEACSSTLATTYSSGSGGERQIVTTDLRKGCTETHTGTSASAPLAAGICALALQANPRMTWRDMQHIVVMTARPANLKASDWVTNAVGRRVSHSFGYGLMDAAAMVELARNWTTVPKQHRCEIRSKIAPRGVPIYGKVRVTLQSDGCRPSGRNQVMYLEHVQSIITLTSTRRGEVQIYLISPQGTKSTLLQKRTRDTSTEGFNNWYFMTTHNWGEISMGTWTLEVENGDSTSELRSWTLVMYGTATPPQGGSNGQFQQQSKPHHEEPECPVDEYMLNNYCYKECPSNFYPSAENVSLTFNETTETKSRGVCEQCHLVCSQCFGPAQNECLACANGFKLTSDHECERRTTQIGSQKTGTVLAASLIAVLVCVVAIIVFVVVFFALQARDHRWLCFKREPKMVDVSKGQYSGVRLSTQEKGLLDSDSEDEEEEVAIYTEEEDGSIQTREEY